jgi:glycosyltransferase involved in cell wall biosynthesis
MYGRRWIVYAGRLVREKGVRDLMTALPKFHADDAGLLIVGDGPDRPILDALARELGVEHRIRSVGAVPHPDVPSYLQHAELVVLPSWYEERGRILLEAMAAGTPVVATRTGGIPATVRDGVNGLLVSPRSPERLATAIDRILGDRELAATMREAGRSVAAEHGVDALAETTLGVYRSALGELPEPVPSGATDGAR